MTEIKNISPSDKNEIYKLWNTCFGDDRDTVDMFFDNSLSYDNTLGAYDGKKLCAMMFFMPEEIIACGKTYSAYYLYALGTDPSYRKQGIMGDMIKRAAEIIKSRGADYLFLVPADEKLFKYYEKHGFIRGFAQKKIILPEAYIKPAAYAEIPPFSARKYRERRINNLKGTSYVSWRINEISLAALYFNSGSGEALPDCFAEHKKEADIIYDLTLPVLPAYIKNHIIKDRTELHISLFSPLCPLPGEIYNCGMYRKLKADLPELSDTFMGITLG